MGAVLSHRFPAGRELPITYYSRTLAPAERNYSQLDKEALALVDGVKRFHHYLYGWPFVLYTDHKPLLGILAADRQVPQILPPHMTRYSVFLAVYSYTLIHRPSRDIAHADALSRCPVPDFLTDPVPVSVVLLIEDSSLPVTTRDVARLSAKDRVLSQVLDWMACGPFRAGIPALRYEAARTVHPGWVSAVGPPGGDSAPPETLVVTTITLGTLGVGAHEGPGPLLHVVAAP